MLFIFPDGSGTARTIPKPKGAGPYPSMALTRRISDGLEVGAEVSLSSSIDTSSCSTMCSHKDPTTGGMEHRGCLCSRSSPSVFSVPVTRSISWAWLTRQNPRRIQPLPADTLEEMLKRIKSNTVREHFRSCALSLPDYRCQAFQTTDRLPAKILIVNASDDSKLKGHGGRTGGGGRSGLAQPTWSILKRVATTGPVSSLPLTLSSPMLSEIGASCCRLSDIFHCLRIKDCLLRTTDKMINSVGLNR